MKEATDERMPKLIDEINFLLKIPKKWQKHFPQIIFSEKSDNKVFYEMPHYPYPTLRKLILTEAISKSDVLAWLDRILEFYFEMVTTKKMDVPQRYMKIIHTDRMNRR